MALSWQRCRQCRVMCRAKTRQPRTSSWRNFRNQYVRLGCCFECADIMQQSEAWQTTHTMLQDSSCPIEARLFAATTLKGKVRSIKSLLRVPADFPDRLLTIYTNCLLNLWHPSEIRFFSYSNCTAQVRDQCGRNYVCVWPVWPFR